MIQRVSAPISVISIYDHQKKSVQPWRIKWAGETYTITKVGLHHTYRQGRTLYHVFSVASTKMEFRLLLNTDTLHWQLEEISDGCAN